MKKIAIFLVFCLFVFSLEAMTLVEDRIGLLSETEKEYVLSALDKASQESGLSLGVVIANGSEGKGDMAFADDFYDMYINDDDGVLLFLNYGERSVYISTSGYGMYAVDDSGEEIVFDAMMPDLERGEWAEAFSVFALSVLELARDYTYSDYGNTVYDMDTGRFMEVERKEEKTFDWALVVISFLVPGLAAGIITICAMKSKLKSERMVDNAEDYVVPSSFVLNVSKDIFLYSTVSKVKKPQNNSGSSSRSSSGHFSSSGRMHGGGGRRF